MVGLFGVLAEEGAEVVEVVHSAPNWFVENAWLIPLLPFLSGALILFFYVGIRREVHLLASPSGKGDLKFSPRRTRKARSMDCDDLSARSHGNAIDEHDVAGVTLGLPGNFRKNCNYSGKLNGFTLRRSLSGITKFLRRAFEGGLQCLEEVALLLAHC